MPRYSVSQDLKDRIPYLRFVERLSAKRICSLLGIKKSLVYGVCSNYLKYGMSFNPTRTQRRRRGRPRILDPVDVRFIKSIISQNPTLYLDELQDQLLHRRGVSLSVPTLFRTLRRLHFSHKGVSAEALERNDLDRARFMNFIGDLTTDPAQLLFIDEAAKNDKTVNRKFGWSLQGHRCLQRRCFIRGQRFSILPVLTMEGIITHDVVPGSVTSAKFVTFLQDHVVCSFPMNLKYDSTTYIIDPPHKSVPWTPKHSYPRQLQYPPR